MTNPFDISCDIDDRKQDFINFNLKNFFRIINNIRALKPGGGGGGSLYYKGSPKFH
jgi:hypothetical protein